MKKINSEKKTKIHFDFYDAQPKKSDLRAEVIAGLQKKQKSIPPKFFYDAKGSELFGRICNLPEYYPTRTEIGILRNFHQDIAKEIGPDAVIVEYGCGNSEKIKILLDSLLRAKSYIAIDIARAAILELAENLAEEYPHISIHALCADFTSLNEIAYLDTKEQNRLAFFPGSSIGNFESQEAKTLLNRISENMTPNAGLLIGVDLKKDPALLNAAYNDKLGITAEFNKNLLHRINRECGTNLEVDQFRHHAFYNAKLGRVEMHLVSIKNQTVSIDDQRFDFKKEESIHTENSYKYSVEEFQNLAIQSGWKPLRYWLDTEGLFSLHYLKN